MIVSVVKFVVSSPLLLSVLLLSLLSPSFILIVIAKHYSEN